jgi:uncharacterized membrane protein
MTDTTKREFDFLEQAALVVLVLQFALFAKMWSDLGLDRAADNFPALMLGTALFVVAQRRIAAQPPSLGAAGWMLASRAAALAMLALGTLAIGIKRLAPDAAPEPALVAGGVFALMWTVIALKGAGVGKLKPGSAAGLRVRWTLQSRLAWDRAHRVLGRVLFFGGLVGLLTSFAVPPLISVAMWVSTIGFAVGSALFESWRTWRLDSGRGGLA